MVLGDELGHVGQFATITDGQAVSSL